MDDNESKDGSKYKITFTPATELIKSILLSDMDQIPSIEVDGYKFHIEVDELSPQVQEIAKKELRETPEIKHDAIQKLRQLLQDEKKLKVPIHKDQWLIRFLRPCKFYPDNALELIKKHYKFKKAHAEIYSQLKPSNTKEIFQQNMLIFQQERDQHGRRILTIELGKKWNPSIVTLDDIIKGCVLLLELGVLEPQTQVCGVVIIIDLEGFTLSQATKLTPMFLKKILHWIQECIPIRIKAVHVVNQPAIYKFVYNVCKMFLREKLKKRLIFHGEDRESLHQHIDPKCLPSIYGGTLDLPLDLDSNIWLEILLLCDEEYELINSYGYVTK